MATQTRRQPQTAQTAQTAQPQTQDAQTQDAQTQDAQPRDLPAYVTAALLAHPLTDAANNHADQKSTTHNTSAARRALGIEQRGKIWTGASGLWSLNRKSDDYEYLRGQGLNKYATVIRVISTCDALAPIVGMTISWGCANAIAVGCALAMQSATQTQTQTQSK